MSEDQPRKKGMPVPYDYTLREEKGIKPKIIGYSEDGLPMMDPVAFNRNADLSILDDIDNPAWEKLSNDSRESAGYPKIFPEETEEETGMDMENVSFVFDPSKVIYEEEEYTLEDSRKEIELDRQRRAKEKTEANLEGEVEETDEGGESFWQ